MLRKYFVWGLLLLAGSCGNAEGVTFNNVVSLGDSLLDDPDGVRSPVAAEHVAERLGVPLTKFAVSGSTSDDLINAGQATQAAAQFGEGDLAMLWIGGNDFFENTLGITFGLYGFLDDLEANVDATLSTLRGAGMEVVVFNLPDLSNIPLTDGISNFRKATQQWNDRLDVLAETYEASVVDVFDLFEQLAADPSDFSLLGNTPILDDPPLFGGDCQFCVFADPVHPSSFAQGFIANVAIETLNRVYDPTGSMPLDELSIVEIALLADVYGGDFDGNQIVDANDLVQWQNDFGGVGSDADGDFDTDGADFLVWQRQFSGSTGAASSLTATVPEPTTTALLLLLLTVYVAARPTNS
ncbi:MAG: PEP-CTERM sorting domain-containing protein [Planctomycetes bacterium]|nr:PEP-CTERM sorting domain-containing protein [Planctomycetota bacterium]